MNTTVVLGIVAVVLVVAVVLFFSARQRQRKKLQERFGPEYAHAVREYGDDASAEKELAARAQRVEQLRIRPLASDQRAKYAEYWRSTQSRFVDDPEGAIGAADTLVAEVMQARGYPMGDFEQQAADISVDHPAVVEQYRAAHAIAGRSARGEATTEDLRQAMVHYRALFDDLIGTHEPTRMEVHR